MSRNIPLSTINGILLLLLSFSIIIISRCSGDTKKKAAALSTTADSSLLSPSMADGSTVVRADVADCVKNADGSFFCIGNVENSTSANDIFLVKLTSDGTVDTTWGSGGYKSYSTDKASAIARDAAGNIFIGGEDSKEAYIMKINSTSGALDTSFNTTGIYMFRDRVNPAAGTEESIKTIAIDTSSSTSSIFIAVDAYNYAYDIGYTTSTSKSDIVIRKLNTAGLMDATFATSGTWVYNGSLNLGDSVKDLKYDSASNALYISGSVRETISVNGGEDVFAVFKLTADTGVMFPGFATSTTGILMIDFYPLSNGYKSEAKGMLLYGSTLYVTGSAKNDAGDYDMVLVGLNAATGAYASSFASGTPVIKEGGYNHADAGKCVVYDGSTLYVGGYITNSISTNFKDRHVWLFNTGGTFLDQYTVTPDAVDDEVNSCTLSNSGKLIMGGYKDGTKASIWIP